VIWKMLIVCSVALLFRAEVCSAKEWRDIVPLHSTCEDVKRILNVSKCEFGYDVDEGRVYISFARKRCLDGWNVPSGTVLSIAVYPKGNKRPEQLGLDLTSFKREVVPYEPVIYYSNGEEGFSVTVTSEGKVHRIDYYPKAKDDYLRYPVPLTAHQRKEGGDVHRTHLLDDYGDLTAREERQRLRDFARKVPTKVLEPSMLSNMQIYIIGYAGRRARRGEALERANHAKAYLSKLADFEKVDIVTIDGGYRDEAAVQLYLRLEGGSEPYPGPTVCPEEIKLIPNRKGTNRRGRKLHMVSKGTTEKK
jgi:hypothetical protein